MILLVVEDMTDLWPEIGERLARSGVPIKEIVYAANWHDAANEAIAMRPDVILFDLGLPDSSPAESVARLPQFTKRFPTVVLSGQNEAAFWRQCVQSGGAGDYLPKAAFLSPGNELFLGHAILNAVFRFGQP
jgi:CheY-like chemotaxis protein